eukprot:TRINITY_DN26483_c0_g1_i1.p1 TRINITY_DN26483_c0_g1~~TRINITY_DN26483_c0_g1_i1.p1  ORF type:complete len:381 (+),score=66.08 TRINITY_DN26483_c0_g1_i1:125-1144(+)
MLRSLVGSEMCIRDSINAEYGGKDGMVMQQHLTLALSLAVYGASLGDLLPLNQLCSLLKSGCPEPQALAVLWAACDMCQSMECTGETGFWLWHNLALESERQYASSKQPRLLELTRAMFDTAHRMDPSQGAALGVARCIGEGGDTKGAFDFLRDAQALAKKEHRGEMLHQMGTMMHDARQWSECKQLWESASELRPDKLAWAASATFMRAYIGDHSKVSLDHAIMSTELRKWNALGKELPPLHPWMTLHLAAPPQVRRLMADGLAAALRVNTMRSYIELEKQPFQLMPHAKTVWAETGRLRVGMLSADFKDKATALLMFAILKYMDPDIEIYILSLIHI